MIRPLSPTSEPPFAIWVHSLSSLRSRMKELAQFALHTAPCSLSWHPGWLAILNEGLQHEVYALEARVQDRTCGFLPLAYVSSVLFGRFLVSLPYLNSNGILAESADVQTALLDRALILADELNVRHLELRHEQPLDHPQLNGKLTSKVHMRLTLPNTTADLWKSYDAKVRNQVRKGEKSELHVRWGGLDCLDAFYSVISHNMRDLGTPVYGRAFFRAILSQFPDETELCVIEANRTPIAAALLTHGPGITEVPTASSLREHNHTCANMLMYRHLVDRAVERGQRIFDFGRSTQDGPTFKFKKQWGARPSPAYWQYALRTGSLGEMRPDNPKYERMIRVWQRLPVRVTQYLGPQIVRGIP